LCRAQRASLFLHGLNNGLMNLAIGVQILLCLVIAYFYPFNIAFGTRDNIFMHFGVMAIPFAFMQLATQEIRKLLVRRLKKDSKGMPNWW
jgi:sodium/potassium-transporting ATPase subunit alpha